jgi:dUTP pyrophosphatase
MSALSKQEILRLIHGKSPLVENYINLEEQVQPNGLDITLREMARLNSPGKIACRNEERQVSDLTPLSFDEHGYVTLNPGPYMITYNEVVHLPKNVMALARPRSSLLRCGVTVGTAVWDAGYIGRSQSLLVVYHPAGFRVQRDARVVQLIFFRLARITDGYRGRYQGENI